MALSGPRDIKVPGLDTISSVFCLEKQRKRRTTYEGTTQIKLFDIVAVDRTGEFGEVDMAIDHRRATAQSASGRLQMERDVHALR